MSSEKQPLENFSLSLVESFKPDENFEKENPQIWPIIAGQLYCYAKVLSWLIQSKGAENISVIADPVDPSRAAFSTKTKPEQRNKTALAFRRFLADMNAYQGDYDTILVAEHNPTGLPILSIDLQNGWKILEKTACLNPALRRQMQFDFVWLKILSERLEVLHLGLNSAPG